MTIEKTKKVRSSKVYIRFEKNGGKVVLKIKLPTEIENLFRNEETAVSTKYGYEYYSITNSLNNNISNNLYYNLDYYGSNLLKQSNGNFSFIRTVGISEEIKTFTFDDLITVDRCKELATALNRFIEDLFYCYCRSYVIESTWTIKHKGGV